MKNLKVPRSTKRLAALALIYFLLLGWVWCLFFFAGQLANHVAVWSRPLPAVGTVTENWMTYPDGNPTQNVRYEYTTLDGRVFTGTSTIDFDTYRSLQPRESWELGPEGVKVRYSPPSAALKVYYSGHCPSCSYLPGQVDWSGAVMGSLFFLLATLSFGSILWFETEGSAKHVGRVLKEFVRFQ